MQIEAVDLMVLKGRPEKGAALLRQWLRTGKAVLALCREEELDRAFAAVYRRATDNLLLLSLAGVSPQSLYPGRMQVLRYTGEKFVTCSQREAAQNQPAGVWGFLLFAVAAQPTTLLLPPGVFSAMLPAAMHLHGHVRCEGRYLFLMLPACRYTGTRVRIDVGDNGCTASVPALPVMAYRIEQYRSLGCTVELRYAPMCDFYELYSPLLDRAEHALADLDVKRRPLSQIVRREAEQAGEYRETLDLAWLQSTFVSPYQHCHMVREILGMSGLDDREETYEALWNRFRPPSGLLSERLNETLEELCRDSRGIVAVQLSCFTDWEHAYDTDSIVRWWPASEIRALAGGLRRRGLAVVNLSPLPFVLEGVLDCSALNLGELAGVIQHADLVAGIDHFCCQLAGVLGKPSLSVYRGGVHTVPLSPNGGRELCFRPIGQNVCLIGGVDRSRLAGAEDVLPLVDDFFDGRWPVGPGFLHGEDTGQGIGICFVRGGKRGEGA